MAWQHSRQKLSPVKICVSMATCLMSRLYIAVSLFCIRHAEPRDTRTAIRLGPHVFVGCLRQFLWRVLPGPLSAIKLIKRGWGLGTRLILPLRTENMNCN